MALGKLGVLAVDVVYHLEGLLHFGVGHSFQLLPERQKGTPPPRAQGDMASDLMHDGRFTATDLRRALSPSAAARRVRSISFCRDKCFIADTGFFPPTLVAVIEHMRIRDEKQKGVWAKLTCRRALDGRIILADRRICAQIAQPNSRSHPGPF